MIRLVPFLVIGFLAVMWWVFDFFTPLPESAQLRGSQKAQAQANGPALPPAVSEVSGRAIRKPLALMVLDVSGSMKKDTDLKERIAAEIFSFFFTRLSERDVPKDELTSVHLALGTFPDEKSRCKIESWNGKPWLRVAANPANYRRDATASLTMVSARMDELIGRPGKNMRRGGGTPHDEAVKITDKLVTQYQTEFGADANVFVVYFTDEPIAEDLKRVAEVSGLKHFNFKKLASGGGSYELVSKDPAVELTYYMWQNEEPHTMVDRFLRGLRLEPSEKNREFRAGFSTAQINQLLPVVICAPGGFLRKGSASLKTNTGVTVPLQEMGDTYYTVLDPSDPEIRNASSIHFEGSENAGITIYSRPQWALVVDPGVVGLLEAAEKAEVRLAFSGITQPAQGGRQTAVLEFPGTDFRREIELAWNPAKGAFTGWISNLRSLPRQGDYQVTWNGPDGATLHYPLKVRRDFDLRFVDTVNQKTGRELRGIQTIPKR